MVAGAGPFTGFAAGAAVLFAALTVHQRDSLIHVPPPVAPQEPAERLIPAPRPQSRRRRSVVKTTTEAPVARKRRKSRGARPRKQEGGALSVWLTALVCGLIAAGLAVAARVWRRDPVPLADLAPGLGDDGRNSPPRAAARAAPRLAAHANVTFNDPRVLDFLASLEVTR